MEGGLGLKKEGESTEEKEKAINRNCEADRSKACRFKMEGKRRFKMEGKRRQKGERLIITKKRARF